MFIAIQPASIFISPVRSMDCRVSRYLARVDVRIDGAGSLDEMVVGRCMAGHCLRMASRGLLVGSSDLWTDVVVVLGSHLASVDVRIVGVGSLELSVYSRSLWMGEWVIMCRNLPGLRV